MRGEKALPRGRKWVLNRGRGGEEGSARARWAHRARRSHPRTGSRCARSRGHFGSRLDGTWRGGGVEERGQVGRDEISAHEGRVRSQRARARAHLSSVLFSHRRPNRSCSLLEPRGGLKRLPARCAARAMWARSHALLARWGGSRERCARAGILALSAARAARARVSARLGSARARRRGARAPGGGGARECSLGARAIRERDMSPRGGARARARSGRV